MLNEASKDCCLGLFWHHCRDFVELFPYNSNVLTLIAGSIETDILQGIYFLHTHVDFELSHTNVRRMKLLKRAYVLANVFF